jgi:hypothetical protein
MRIIPFSRDLAFDPEHVQAMVSAFEIVCTKLRLVRGKGDQLAELVALKIVDLAKAGEWNAIVLASRVIDEFQPRVPVRESPISMAARHVLQARGIVGQQKERIAHLKAVGASTLTSEHTLRRFEANLAIFEEHLCGLGVRPVKSGPRRQLLVSRDRKKSRDGR